MDYEDKMNRKNRLNSLYIYIFIFWYASEILFNSTLNTILGISVDKISNWVAWLVFGTLMLQIVFFQSYTRRQLIIIAMVTLPIVIATLLSGNRYMLSGWMFVVAARNIDWDDVIYIAYRILLIMIPFVVALYLFGFIENVTLIRGNVRRFSLGFSHPNQLGLRVFQLAVCHCYVHKDRIRKLDYILICLIIIFLVRVPNSKTAYIVTTVLVCMLLLYNFVKKRDSKKMKFFENSLLLGTFCFCFFSIYFAYIDVKRNSVLAVIDKWMSSRFSSCHIVWQLYGVSALGQRVYISEDERKLVGIKTRLWLDNAYVGILLRYGILVFLIFSVGYLCLIKFMIIQKQYVLAIILFLYALYGVMENGLYMVTHNIFLITFSFLLYGRSIQGNRQKQGLIKNGAK